MPVHPLRRDRSSARRRRAGRGARGRGEASLRRGRLHQRGPVLQAAEQRGHARRPRVVGERTAAGRGAVRERDGLRLAAGRPGIAGADHARHDVRGVLPLKPRLFPHDAMGALARPRPGSAARAFGRHRRWKRRLPLRAERVPRPGLERDELLGGRGLQPGTAVRHARAEGVLDHPGPGCHLGARVKHGEGQLRRAACREQRQRGLAHPEGRPWGGGRGKHQLRRPDPERHAFALPPAQERGHLHGHGSRRSWRGHRRGGQPAGG